MRVYEINMVEEIKLLRNNYHKENGKNPTGIEMSEYEYSLLKEQIASAYSIRPDFDTADPNKENRMIFGMKIKIKE